MAHRIRNRGLPYGKTSSVYLGKSLTQERLRLKAFLIFMDEARSSTKSLFRQLFWVRELLLKSWLDGTITWQNLLEMLMTRDYLAAKHQICCIFKRVEKSGNYLRSCLFTMLIYKSIACCKSACYKTHTIEVDSYRSASSHAGP